MQAYRGPVRNCVCADGCAVQCVAVTKLVQLQDPGDFIADL